MKFRDVSLGLRILRDFLLGNREPHQLHNRFNPLLAPRTLPQPEIPRTTVLKYAEQYYYQRSALDSVHPPVVAPIALGVKQSKQLSAKPDTKPCPPSEGELVFPEIPTPGMPYWWDGHSYYECVADVPRPKPPCPPCAPPCQKPSPPPRPCGPPPCPEPKKTPPGVCDPCEPIQKCP